MPVTRPHRYVGTLITGWPLREELRSQLAELALQGATSSGSTWSETSNDMAWSETGAVISQRVDHSKTVVDDLITLKQLNACVRTWVALRPAAQTDNLIVSYP